MSDASDILQWVSSRRAEIVDLTGRLVEVATENPPGRLYPECVQVLAAELASLGLPVEILEVDSPGHEGRLVLRSGHGQGPTLYLHGHYDVVPASSPTQFQSRLEGGRLTGRGSSDMKGALAAMAYALASLKAFALGGRVELVVVPDEETGGRYGSQWLLEQGELGKNGIGAIVGEPTGGVIWDSSRGAITLRVRLPGREAHVGLQHEGSNAFENALPLLAALLELKQEVETRHTNRRIVPPQAARSILLLGGEVSGGNRFNTVPGAFVFTIDRRFNPEEDLQTERARLMDVIEAYRAETGPLEVEVIQEAASGSTDTDGPLGLELAASVQRMTGKEPRFELCPGLLETRFYLQSGVPALAYGPGILSVSHGPEEYVEVDRLVEAAQVYALTSLKLLGRSGRFKGGS